MWTRLWFMIQHSRLIVYALACQRHMCIGMWCVCDCGSAGLENLHITVALYDTLDAALLVASQVIFG